MARKKKNEEHANHERWLVSYADFITLLFAFFTTMYAISTADTVKLQKLVGSLQGAFGSRSGAVIQKLSSDAETVPFSPKFITVPIARPASFNVGRSEEDVFRALRDNLRVYLVKGLTEGKVRVIISDRGLVISVSDSGLFRPGEADINPESIPLLTDLAKSLVDLPNFVRVEGYTDNMPVHSGRFPSNWELSSARASQIVRFFIEKCAFPPDRLGAAGYAEFRPVATNLTAEGRALNRRVDIVVLRNRFSVVEP